MIAIALIAAICLLLFSVTKCGREEKSDALPMDSAKGMIQEINREAYEIRVKTFASSLFEENSIISLQCSSSCFEKVDIYNLKKGSIIEIFFFEYQINGDRIENVTYFEPYGKSWLQCQKPEPTTCSHVGGGRAL